MIQKICFHLWSLRHEFIKYTVVGVSGLFLDMGTLILFTERFGFHPVVSVIFNQAVVLSYNFTLNKYWSFRNRALPHRQIVRYGTLMGWNYLFSVGAMYVFHTHVGFDYRLVRLASIAVMVSWNFLLYKFWVYRETEIKTQGLNDGSCV